MNSLKTKMALALAGDPVEGGWCFDPTDEEYSDPHAHNMRMDFLRQADAAIAAFEEALLQPEVVEAVAEVVHQKNWQGAYTPLEWDEETDDIRSAIMLDARAALQAALAAITGTEGSE